MSILDKEYLSNIKWQSSGNIVAQVINIMTLPLITRFFSPADVGLLNVFVQVLAFLTIFISFRVEHIIMLPKIDRHAHELTSFVFGFGLISSLIFTVITIVLLIFGFIPTPYQAWAPILPIVAFLTVLSQAVQQLSQRSAIFKLSGISEVVNRASNSVFAIISGLFNGPGVLLSIAVGVGLTFKILTFWRLFELINNSVFLTCVLGIRRIKRLSLQKVLISLITSHGLLFVTSMAPLWFIAKEWGNDYVGYFTLVLATLALPTRLLGVAVGQVFYQRAASIFADQLKFSDLLIKNLKILFFIAVPGFSIVLFFGDYLYPLIFGASWTSAGIVAQTYVFASALSFLSVPFDRSALIVNAWWYGPIWHILRMLTTLLVIYISDLLALSFYNFISLITVQSSLMYIIDIFASYRFSLRVSPFSSNVRA